MFMTGDEIIERHEHSPSREGLKKDTAEWHEMWDSLFLKLDLFGFIFNVSLSSPPRL